MLALDQEGCHIRKIGFRTSRFENLVVKKQIMMTAIVKDVFEIATQSMQTEEPIQVLQIDATDVGRLHDFIAIGILHHHGLTTIQHLLHILRNLLEHGITGQHE
jgi:hypothetical protein